MPEAVRLPAYPPLHTLCYLCMDSCRFQSSSIYGMHFLLFVTLVFQLFKHLCDGKLCACRGARASAGVRSKTEELLCRVHPSPPFSGSFLMYYNNSCPKNWLAETLLIIRTLILFTLFSLMPLFAAVTCGHFKWWLLLLLP